ncbi:MAG: hypothetical protein PHH49_03345 [Candidatus Omnitrophica bacterium]|nr:hypothetical protein [Candidatus Omnitrophota bacterium]MDD5487983.1 hypothetical protein [Candidatus Omnitrophota bacterium]
MTTYRDGLGREFIELNRLSTALGVPTTIVKDEIRDKRLLAINHENSLYVLKNDVQREYPNINVETLLGFDGPAPNSGWLSSNDDDDSQGDQPHTHDIPLTRDIDMYSQDGKTELLLGKIEQVRSVVTTLEKSISDIAYLQKDTKTLTQRLDEIHNAFATTNEKLSAIPRPKRTSLLRVLTGAILLSFLFAIMAYNSLSLKKVEDTTSGSVLKKDEMISFLTAKYEELSSEHASSMKTHISDLNAKNHELERLNAIITSQKETINDLNNSNLEKEAEIEMLLSEVESSGKWTKD